MISKVPMQHNKGSWRYSEVTLTTKQVADPFTDGSGDSNELILFVKSSWIEFHMG